MTSFVTVPAENQIILPTPLTKVRSIWPVFKSNDKIQVKIRPLNKITAHQGSESFELTTETATAEIPMPTAPMRTTTSKPRKTTTKQPKKLYNKYENLNDIKGKLILGMLWARKFKLKYFEMNDFRVKVQSFILMI